jgi:hypothetical protein
MTREALFRLSIRPTVYKDTPYRIDRIAPRTVLREKVARRQRRFPRGESDVCSKCCVEDGRSYSCRLLPNSRNCLPTCRSLRGATQVGWKTSEAIKHIEAYLAKKSKNANFMQEWLRGCGDTYPATGAEFAISSKRPCP